VIILATRPGIGRPRSRLSILVTADSELLDDEVEDLEAVDATDGKNEVVDLEATDDLAGVFRLPKILLTMPLGAAFTGAATAVPVVRAKARPTPVTELIRVVRIPFRNPRW